MNIYELKVSFFLEMSHMDSPTTSDVKNYIADNLQDIYIKHFTVEEATKIGEVNMDDEEEI